MLKKTYFAIIIALFNALFFTYPALASSNQAADYLLEIGESFYQNKRYDEAAIEFKKVLLLDPANKKAVDYLDAINSRSTMRMASIDMSLAQEAPKAKATPKTLEAFDAQETPKPSSSDPRENMMDLAFNHLTGSPAIPAAAQKSRISAEANPIQVAGMNVTGEIQLSAGVDTEKGYWKEANYDMNEKNWRFLSYNDPNNGVNTFDTRVFDRLRVDLDTINKEGFGFHTDITVDPWSYTGKGPKTTLTTGWGDTAEVELKYWSSTGRILPETVYSSRFGNSFSIPEAKVDNSEVTGFTSLGAFSPSDSLYVPETKINMEFQPIREMWVDYNNDIVKFRIFPMAYQDQALTTDDPIGLSNRHIYWEPSPWLRKWRRGIYNYGATPVDFTKGWWDDSLAFLTKDSDAVFLTALRGMSLTYEPQESTILTSTVASPKGLWQDYSIVDNIASATRLKQYVGDNLLLGSTYTARVGYNVDQDDKIDSRNNVLGTDMSYEFKQGTKFSVEGAASQAKMDLSDAAYKTRRRGNAYYFSLINRYPQKEILDTTYDAIKVDKGEPYIVKSKFYGSHMDTGFTPALSTYHQTRRDSSWSRHLHFRKPFQYYYAGLYSSSLGWDDIKPFGIGDGIDIGRDTLGFRTELIYPEEYENLFDIRNVHSTKGKFLENVVRDEATWEATEKLTVKGIALYQYMPKTKGGIDPFVTNTDTDLETSLANTQIKDNQDCSLKTGSLGLEYDFFEWMSLNGIWEHTNDYTLAYNNFPRALYNSANRSYIYDEYGNLYRALNPWLYDQGLYPNPPYTFYDIYKAGLRLTPIDKMEVYFDYTRNEFENAGIISDDMNHIGVEVGYLPTDKLSMCLRYVYSRWKDLDRMAEGINDPRGHHNVFSELRYKFTKMDELILMYGEGGYTPIGTMTFDPFGGSTSVLDTQHIIRAYYRRKF